MTNEEDVKICQTEIRRLRVVIRENRDALQNTLTIDYQNLFEMWGDFDDAETPGMGNFDAGSFNAFCYGYESAIQRIREAL